MGISLYTHRCPTCGLTYRVALNRNRHSLLRTRCPDCKAKSFFDNSDGALEYLPRKRRLSFPIRQYDLKEGHDFDPEREEPAARTVEEAIQRHAMKTRRMFGRQSQANQDGYYLVGLTRKAPAKRVRQPRTLKEDPSLEQPRSPAARATSAPAAPEQESPVVPGANGSGTISKPPVSDELRLQTPAPGTNGHRPLPNRPPLPEQEDAAPQARAQAPDAVPPADANGSNGRRIRSGGSAATTPPVSRSPEKPVASSPPSSSAPRAAFSGARLNEADLPEFPDYLEEMVEPVLLEQVPEDARDEPKIPVVRARQVFWKNPETDREPGESRGAFAWRMVKETCLALIRIPGEIGVHVMTVLRLPGDYFQGHRSLKETLALGGLYAFVLSQLGLLVLFLLFQFPRLIFFEDPDGFLPRLLPVTSNRIVDRDGRLIAELFHKKTSNLKLENFPPTLRDKLIFVEDDSFYEHNGIRWSSILRATLRNARAMNYVEGGSTLTQQLARIVLRNRKRTLLRKFREAVMAVYFERKLSKDQILNAYINHVYMGHGAVGMQVAGEFYFRRPLEKLNFVEEMMLVALLPAPEKFSPLHNPDLLEKRMDRIFQRMVAEEYTAVTPAIYEAQKRSLFRKFNRSPNENVFAVRVNEAPYVAEYVRLLIKKVLGEEWQYDSSLTVHTTIDSRLQRTADRQTVEYINRVQKRYPPRRVVPLGPDQNRMKKIIMREYRANSLGGFLMGMPVYPERPPRLQAAVVGLAPESGEILFLQGGSEFSSGNQLNRVIDMRRQTGSAIKPIVYSAGIERGLITPATQIKDEPLNMGSWEPRNFNDKYSGHVSVREALKRSLNVPSVRIGMRVGMSGLSDQFQKFFFSDKAIFKKRFRSDYTISIGSLEMSPLEMAVAFSAFGNNGVIQRPYLVREIKDHTGRVLYTHQEKDEFNMRIPASHRAIPGDVAQIMASLLKDSGRNGGVGRGGFKGGPLLGKTGTSNDSRDAWFIGIVPRLVAAVWVGYDESIYVMPGATGSTVAGPLWGRIVSEGMDVNGEFQFSPRARYLRICSSTGRLSNQYCPRTYSELFPGSSAKRSRCWKHKKGSRSEKSERPSERRRQQNKKPARAQERSAPAPKPVPPDRTVPRPEKPAPVAPSPAVKPKPAPAPAPVPARPTPPPAPRAKPKPPPAMPALPPETKPTIRKPVQAAL